MFVERARVPGFYRAAAYKGAEAYHPLYALAVGAPSIAGIFKKF